MTSDKAVPGFPEPPFPKYWNWDLKSCIDTKCSHQAMIKLCRKRDEDIDVTYYEESVKWLEQRIQYLKTLKLLGRLNG